MKLPKALLGAIVLGVTTQATTSCDKKEDPAPITQKPTVLNGILKNQPPRNSDNCPGCGLG